MTTVDHRPIEKSEINKLLLVITLFAFVIIAYLLTNPLQQSNTIVQCPACNTSCEPIPECEEIVKYVCSDGAVVDDPTECVQEIEVEVEEPEIILEEVSYEGTLIQEVTFQTACVDGYKGGTIFYDVISPSQNVSYQFRLPGGEYEEILLETGKFTSRKHFVICDPKCPYRGDFKLNSNTTYIMRLVFDRTVEYDRLEYSQEHIINLQPGSEYMSKEC